MKNIAIIPARGGSKRIPRKNIKLFNNKPMIAWSIEAAKKSDCFDEIIVSTDDEEISSIAKEFGAKVPFLRPKEISDDFTPTQPVIQHAINFCKENNFTFDSVCCIYATAPFIKSDDLIKALELLKNSNPYSYIFVATSYPYPIQRSISINKNGYSSMIYPDMFEKRSQDLPESFHDAGQFYWGHKNTWFQPGNLFDNGRPLIVPRWRVQDIDTLEDFKRAEILQKII